MSNLLKSNSISLFRVSLLILISVFIPKFYLYGLIILYLMFREKKAVPVYVVLIFMIILSSLIRCDFIPFGIVDCKQGKYYIADKIVYKVKIETQEELSPGDLLCFDTEGSYSVNVSDQKRNIRFVQDSYERTGTFMLRKRIGERISGFTEIVRSGLYGFLYDQYTYEGLDGITYGIASYYVLKEIRKRSQSLCLFLILILSLCFSFQIKYLFLLIEVFCSKKGYDRFIRLFLEIIVFSLLNGSLFQNYSILIPLLLNIFVLIDADICFRNILFLLQSFLFGEIDLIQSVLFRPILYTRILFYLFSVLLLFLPSLENLYIASLSVLEKILSFHLSIRGSPSIWTLLVLLCLRRSQLLRKDLFFSLAIVLLLLNPLNHPFSKVSFIDVGQGDSTMIRNVIGHRCILIDTGSKYNYSKLKKYLFKQGIYQIDYLIVTHDDEDHNGNVERLKEDFKVTEIVESGKDILYNGLSLNYHDLGEFDNDNDNSLVYSMDAGGITFLFTGDISLNAESIFVQKYCPMKIDVLKVAHHGSDTSTGSYFVGSILPEYAVISTSGQYGHPKRSVLETLKNYKVYYFNTRYSGTVSFCFLRSFRFIETDDLEFVIMNRK